MQQQQCQQYFERQCTRTGMIINEEAYIHHNNTVQRCATLCCKPIQQVWLHVDYDHQYLTIYNRVPLSKGVLLFCTAHHYTSWCLRLLGSTAHRLSALHQGFVLMTLRCSHCQVIICIPQGWKKVPGTACQYSI